MHRGYSYFNMLRNPNFMKSMPSSSILIFIRILYLFKMPILLKHEWENRKKNLLLFAKSNFELKPNRFWSIAVCVTKLHKRLFWCRFAILVTISDVIFIVTLAMCLPSIRRNEKEREREKEGEGERDWFYLVTESFALNLVKNM